MVQVARPRVLLLLAVLAACHREARLATLDDRILSEQDFQQHLQSLYSADETRSIHENPTRRQAELGHWLDMLAIAAKARRLGIDGEPRFAKAIELMEMRTLARMLTEENRQRIESITRVAPEEVQQFYEEHKSEYASKPSFTARQVLVYVRGNPAFPEQGLTETEARGKARQALQQLRSGKTWDEVARRFSDDRSNNQKGGLIRDGQFGFFAPEVEQAVRTQALGKPGDVVRSTFGYHVLQVESRRLDTAPQPFVEVELLLRERLSALHAQQAHKAFVEPMAREMGLKVTDAVERDVPFLDENAVAAGEVLATLGERRILESDFRWFLKDALPASQRTAVLSRPGARKSWLASFLDELVLEAKARRDGLDKSPEFLRQRATNRQTLLLEFVQERDKTGAFCQCQQTPEEREASDRAYFDRVRVEVGLQMSDKALAKPLSKSQSRSPRIE